MADLNIQVSDLRDRVTFQSPTISKTSGGAQTEAYANVGTNPTVWALVVYDHGQEVVANDAEKSVQRATVTIRHRSDVLATWQILIDGAAWKIFSVDHVRGRNRWTVLRVERVIGTV
jgi:SPP1 family predicted phage head-tail adaptor